MNTSQPTLKDSNGYIPVFDGVRGIFCICILLCHAQFTYIKIPYFIGYLLLYTFFILSSFLITKNLLHFKIKFSVFGDYFKLFYLKRILRIFPNYYLYLFIVGILAAITYKTPLKSLLGITYEFKNFWPYLFSYTYNFKDIVAYYKDLNYAASFAFPHIWSLCMEEQFYLIIPFLVFFLSKKRMIYLSISVIVLFSLIRIIGFGKLDQTIKDDYLKSFIFIKSSIFQFDTFFFGALLALVNIKKHKAILFSFISLLIIFLLLMYINIYTVSNETKTGFGKTIHSITLVSNGIAPYFYHTFINTLSVLFILCVYYYQDIFKIFKHPVATYLGKLSYSIYLYQYLFIVPIAYLLYPYLKTKYHPVLLLDLGCFILILACLIPFSHFIFHKFELYFINIKDKLNANRK